jgi:urease beta subunit
MSQGDVRGPTGAKEAPGAGKSRTTGSTQPGAASGEIEGSPGQVIYGAEPVTINAGRPVTTVSVLNTADRPVRVGSHYHFAEANPALEFDRQAAWGRRMNLLAGGMQRFDPGATVEVELVPLAGRRIVRGLRGEVGSIEPGKLADFVLWEPATFGMRPSYVFKSGMAAAALLGDPNAATPTPQPMLPRLGYNVRTRAAAATSVAFVAPVAIESGLADRLAVERKLVPVADMRGRSKADLPENKADLPENTALPKIEVNPDTFAVHIDGEEVTHEPADALPMTQRYMLF